MAIFISSSSLITESEEVVHPVQPRRLPPAPSKKKGTGTDVKGRPDPNPSIRVPAGDAMLTGGRRSASYRRTREHYEALRQMGGIRLEYGRNLHVDPLTGELYIQLTRQSLRIPVSEPRVPPPPPAPPSIPSRIEGNPHSVTKCNVMPRSSIQDLTEMTGKPVYRNVDPVSDPDNQWTARGEWPFVPLDPVKSTGDHKSLKFVEETEALKVEKDRGFDLESWHQDYEVDDEDLEEDDDLDYEEDDGPWVSAKEQRRKELVLARATKKKERAKELEQDTLIRKTLRDALARFHQDSSPVPVTKAPERSMDQVIAELNASLLNMKQNGELILVNLRNPKTGEAVKTWVPKRDAVIYRSLLLEGADDTHLEGIRQNWWSRFAPHHGPADGSKAQTPVVLHGKNPSLIPGSMAQTPNLNKVPPPWVNQGLDEGRESKELRDFKLRHSMLTDYQKYSGLPELKDCGPWPGSRPEIWTTVSKWSWLRFCRLEVKTRTLAEGSYWLRGTEIVVLLCESFIPIQFTPYFQHYVKPL